MFLIEKSRKKPKTSLKCSTSINFQLYFSLIGKIVLDFVWLMISVVFKINLTIVLDFALDILK